MHFQGSMVALVTPMHEDGTIDKKAFCDLIEWHIQAKTSAIIITGTTGESATLDVAEQQELIALAIKQAAGRLPIIAGTGTNSTQKTIKLTEAAKAAGAAACLIVTPYYNKPTQNGLYEHYKAVAEKVNIPIILYNVPGRTGCDLLPETVERLAQIPNIIGVKEATGKLERVDEIRKRCPDSFEIYSGDDATGLGLIQAGGNGIISVTANIAPEKMVAMCDAALNGDQKLAEKINEELMGLHTDLFLEPNPTPVKWALFTAGRIPSGIRLPLLPLDKKYHQQVKAAMQQAGVIK